MVFASNPYSSISNCQLVEFCNMDFLTLSAIGPLEQAIVFLVPGVLVIGFIVQVGSIAIVGGAKMRTVAGVVLRATGFAIAMIFCVFWIARIALLLALRPLLPIHADLVASLVLMSCAIVVYVLAVLRVRRLHFHRPIAARIAMAGSLVMTIGCTVGVLARTSIASMATRCAVRPCASRAGHPPATVVFLAGDGRTVRAIDFDDMRVQDVHTLSEPTSRLWVVADSDKAFSILASANGSGLSAADQAVTAFTGVGTTGGFRIAGDGEVSSTLGVADLRPPNQRGLEVKQAGHSNRLGIVFGHSAQDRTVLGFDVPFFQRFRLVPETLESWPENTTWDVDHVTILPGDQVVFALGRRHIMLLDTRQKSVCRLAQGSCPIVFLR